MSTPLRRRLSGDLTPSAPALMVAALAVTLGACVPESDSGDAAPADAADLILFNGTIVTLEDQVPEPEFVAVRDGRILAVGAYEEMPAFEGPGTEMLDLKGALAIPGLIEGHGHFMGVGEMRMTLNFLDAPNWEAIVAEVAAAAQAAEPGVLIQGRGWHQEKWDTPVSPSVDGLPHHDALSAVTPDNPVILEHASGHAVFANARAMEIAGIDASTPDPEGGEIVRDPQGNPIGVFRETAERLLRPVFEAAPPVDRREVARMAMEEVLENGITSFQDAGVQFETLDLYRELADAGEMKVRLYVAIRDSNEEMEAKLADYHWVGYADDHLTVNGIKKSIDGALGSHGAWLLEPYTDLPTSVGLNTVTPETIREAGELALQHGYQLWVHAIGDRGNREALDVYEELYGVAGSDPETLRWRIEHAQHLHPDDIPRFGELGVIASMQGVHCTSDGPWVEEKLGAQRAEDGAYVWQKLMETGAVVTNGTDAPVEDVSAIASYYSTVSRMMNTGERFYPDQRMSRLEALRSYTVQNAYASFEEGVKGTLAAGKYADITVLDRNILEIPEEEIPLTRVLYTIVNGEIRYRNSDVLGGGAQAQ